MSAAMTQRAGGAAMARHADCAAMTGHAGCERSARTGEGAAAMDMAGAAEPAEGGCAAWWWW
jgi:hypothetical protein